jgi:hypothetical protein
MQSSTNIIFKSFIFCILAIIISCNPLKNKNIESSVNTFDECIYPKGAFIYKNYLIILGKNIVSGLTSREIRDSLEYSKKTKIIAIDLYSNKIDNSAFRQMSTDNLFWLYVKNDTLFGNFKSSDRNKNNWAFWNNGEWIETNDILGRIKFNSSLLRKDCHLIFEDPLYYIYSFNQGEFGSAVIFLNKKTEIPHGYPMPQPVQAFKENNNYIVTGFFDYTNGSEVIEFANPDLLPVIPDSLIQYSPQKKEKYPKLLYLDQYLEFQILLALPDSFQELIRETEKHKFDETRIDDSTTLISLSFFGIFDSLLRYTEKAVYILDNKFSTNRSGLFCKAVIPYRNKRYCLFDDYEYLYLCKLNSSNMDTVFESRFYQFKKPVYYFIHNFGETQLLFCNYSEWDSFNSNFKCILINDNFIKTYHFTPED